MQESSIASKREERLNGLRACSRAVIACLTRDEQQVPDPWDLLQSSYSRDYLPTGNAGETSLRIKQVHVIPDILLSQFEGTDCRCFMGLFPEIGRVWMTVDNRLFLWDYATGRDYTCFDQLDQVIIDVALVRPRPNIFVPSITHVIAVVTATQVVLLGVSFASAAAAYASREESSTSPAGKGDSIAYSTTDLLIHKTGLSFPTDEISMLSIVSTRTGRIFAGGQDGNIYEFVYQAEEGWFTRKCRKLNRTASLTACFTPTFLRVAQSSSAIVALTYSSSANTIHALGEDSSIQTFYLAPNDDGFERISHLSDLYEHASRLCPTGVLGRKGFKIVSIDAVEMHDSAYIALVAVTASSVKLYFTTLKRDERAWARSQLIYPAMAPGRSGLRGQVHLRIPSPLELVHVRLTMEEPRQRDMRRLVHAWNPNVHTAMYRCGVTIAASALGDQEDAIVATVFNQALAFSTTRSTPMEAAVDISIDGKVWDIVEEGNLWSAALCMSSSFYETVSSIATPSRTFLLLSNAGVYVLEKSTPVQELQRLLAESNGCMDSPALASFFDAYSPEQACFLAIVLACSIQRGWKGPNYASALGAATREPSSGTDHKLSTTMSLWAVSAMLKHGGSPRATEASFSPLEYGGGLSSEVRPSFGSRIDFEFSHLHHGLYLYFARLVSSFWNQSIGKFVEPSAETTMALHSFGEFISRNSLLSTRAPPASTPAPSAPSGTSLGRTRQAIEVQQAHLKLEEAFRAENESIRMMSVLVQSTLELLAFLSICRDYRVLDSSSNRSTLGEAVDFEEVLTTVRGRAIIADIGALLVQRQLKMRSSVDSLCQILLQRCSLFFGDSDVIVYQGSESLERAAQTNDPHERAAQLQESLSLFLKGSGALSLAVITDICSRYALLAFFPGIIDLCLTVASARDPDNIALVALRNPNLHLDDAQQEIINMREGVYGIIFDALGAVHGVEARTVSAALGKVDVERLQKETLGRAIRSRDELFHTRLYDWLISQHLSSLILDLDTPFIVPFLEVKFSTCQDEFKDILWRYLARHGQFVQAARILDELAVSPELYECAPSAPSPRPPSCLQAHLAQ